MKSQLSQELRNLSLQELAQKIDELRRESFSLQLTARTSHVKNYAQFKILRRDVARALTIFNEKKMQAYSEALAEAVKEWTAKFGQAQAEQ